MISARVPARSDCRFESLKDVRRFKEKTLAKILYYDCFAGISGDMNLAAMIDLGVPEEYLRAELEKLGVKGWSLKAVKDMRKGITGTRVDVELAEERHHDSHPIKNQPHEVHTHGENEHAEHHQHQDRAHAVSHHEGHRNLAMITEMIEKSTLSESVKRKSVELFRKVAEAEAKVHGKPIDEIHFHEVGALDSIVDMVGAAICLDYLKPDLVHASTVELGGGFVKCAHGTFPVPAPATVEILKGVPVKSGAAPFETTTPTGAAILASFVGKFTDDKRFRIGKIAYGIGHRDTEIPNVLRVFLGETDDASVEASYRVLECNIDDMNPEIYGYLQEKLFANGADDVYFTPIVMKKSRPAVMVSILCHADREPEISRMLFRETTTLGIRSIAVSKKILSRTERTLKTSLGEVRMKSAWLDGQILKEKPEYEDCRKIAEEKGIPLREVFEVIAREGAKNQ